MNNCDYQKIPAVSSNWLKKFLDQGPAECYRQHFEPPSSTEVPSAPLRMGTIVHCLSLTPHWFSSEFLVTDYERRSSAGKARYNQLMATGLTLIKPAELERAQAMVVALYSHPDARKWLQGGQKERVIIQPRPSGLLPLKARLDVHHPDQRLVVELKTIHALNAIDRAIDRYRYALSAAFYATISHAETVQFIFVQTTPPHDIAIFEMPRWQLQDGREQWESALQRFDECWKTNHWPDTPLDLTPNRNPSRSLHRVDLPVGELAL